MNRRAFLRALLATATVAKAHGKELIRTQDSLYFNDLYGIQLSKPSDWIFNTLTQFAELAENVENEISHEELVNLFSGDYDEPFIVMSTGEEIVSVFEPMIYIHADVIDGDVAPDFEIIHEHIIRIHDVAMKDFAITEDFKLFDFSGFSSSYHIANFTQERTDGPSVESRYKMLVTSRENILYTINSIDSPRNGINTDKEFNTLLSSIQFI